LHWKVTPAWLAVNVNVARGVVDFAGGVEVIVVTGDEATTGASVVEVARGASGWVSEPTGALVTPVDGLLV
jgi:hypothetical protein